MNPNDNNTPSTEASNNSGDASIAATQTAIPGLPGGVVLDLLPPEILDHARELLREPEPEEPAPSPAAAELDECMADLQESLDVTPVDALGRKKPKYVIPDVATLAACAVGRRGRKKIEHAPEHAHLAEESDRKLARRMAAIYRFKADGLSPLDMAAQKEWTEARAVGAGWYRYKDATRLPFEFTHLGGHRSAYARRIILCALMLAMAHHKNGMRMSAPDAHVVWKIPNGTWWAAIAWLEKEGFLIRGRRYRNNHGDMESGAPVHKVVNWYGPGPKLVALFSQILGLFGGKSEEAVTARKAARAQVQQQRQGRQRIAARRRTEAQRKRRGLPSRPPAGRDAHQYAMAVAQAERCVRQREADAERRRKIAAGDPSGFRETGDTSAELGPPTLDEAQLAQLEQAAANPQVIHSEPQGEPRGDGRGSSSPREGPCLVGPTARSLAPSIDVRQMDATLRVRNLLKQKIGQASERAVGPTRHGPSRGDDDPRPSPRGSPDTPSATQPTGGVDPPPAADDVRGAERLAPGQVTFAEAGIPEREVGWRDG